MDIKVKLMCGTYKSKNLNKKVYLNQIVIIKKFKKDLSVLFFQLTYLNSHGIL